MNSRGDAMQQLESLLGDSKDSRGVPVPRWFDRLMSSPGPVAGAGLAGIAIVAILDAYFIELNVGLAFWYLLPFGLVAMHANRWQVLLLALLCTFSREAFAPWHWQPQYETRLINVMFGFAGVGLFLREVAANRRQTLVHIRELAEHIALRQEAEANLRTLIESSPAAVFTLDSKGTVLLANRATEQLLELEPGGLLGKAIGPYLPTVAEALRAGPDFALCRTATTCRGRRAGGESFLACVWFATYPGRDGLHLSAIVTDASEDLRDWQETSLQNLLRSTRVLVGSVSHEIRNICAAIQVVHKNLGRLPQVAGNEDYAALSTLAQGLSRVATLELSSNTTGESEYGFVNLTGLLDELRIILEPLASAAEVQLVWNAPERSVEVQADHHGLLQVFLNLARNSLRVLEKAPVRNLLIDVQADNERVIVRFRDSGPGIRQPERLFQPFQEGADAVGLGLFVSRSIVRACGGELYHEPGTPGACMCVSLRRCPESDAPIELFPNEVSA